MKLLVLLASLLCHFMNPSGEKFTAIRQASFKAISNLHEQQTVEHSRQKTLGDANTVGFTDNLLVDTVMYRYGFDSVDTGGLTGVSRNYYFSTNSGDDSRSPTQAQDSTTPWKTLARLNAYMNELKPGDAILFKRNEVFDGSIIPGQSGTAGAPIVFSAYGLGNKPVINGLSTLKTWYASGNGIWEASLGFSATLNMVVVNGTVRGMGRFPNITEINRGYLTVDSHSGSSQLTDNDLGSAVNWTGAEVVVRKNDWTLDRAPITSHSGNTLNFESPTGHQPTDGYGYFIQNSPATLDQTGEWYYDRVTGKLKMFFGNDNPKNYSVKASIVDTMVNIFNKSYLTFDNLSFRGADIAAFKIINGSNITIQNCILNYTGLDGISADNSPYLRIEDNLINHSNNSGIRLNQGSSNASIKSNLVKNSGLIAGMGSSNNQQHDGIFVDSSPANVIDGNIVDSTGYCGITFTGDHISVTNNFVNHFCMTVNDGGGIYTWGGWDKVDRTIKGNVILNGMGAPEGTKSTVPGGAVGIYTDDRSSHIDILDNTVSNCVRSGIFLHNSHEINITGNTLHNNATQLSMAHDQLEPADPTRNLVVERNILSSGSTTQLLLDNESMLDDVDKTGSFNNNYYIRPANENGIINTNILKEGNYTATRYDLSAWSSAFGYDRQSAISPVKIPTYRLNKLIGANKYLNGNFDTNVDGVLIQSSPGKATGTYSSDGRLDGGTLQVAFDGSSGAKNAVGTFLPLGAVTAGKNYLITFSLIGGSSGKTIKAFVLQNGGTYNRLSEINYFTVSSSRTENSFVFTAPSSESSVMIDFELNGSDCPFWLDNVKVYEADVTLLHTDDYMRFEYNPSDKPLTVSLTGSYVDAKNVSYNGSITIAPHASLVLIKKTNETTQSSDGYSTNRYIGIADAGVAGANGMVANIRIVENPVRQTLRLAMEIPASTRSTSINVHSLSGIKIKSLALANGSTTANVDVSSLTPGAYFVEINCDGHISSKKFIKD